MSSFLQFTSGGTAKGLVGASDTTITGRVRIKATTNTVFLGGPGVTAGNGIQVPSGDATAYLELSIDDPSEVFVIGTGVVYIILD